MIRSCVVYIKLGVFYTKSLVFCIKPFVIYINSFAFVVICCVSLINCRMIDVVVIDIKSAVIFVKLRSCYTSRRERTLLDRKTCPFLECVWSHGLGRGICHVWSSILYTCPEYFILALQWRSNSQNLPPSIGSVFRRRHDVTCHGRPIQKLNFLNYS